MIYLSICSGIEAATVAWHPLGWTPFAFAEIEKFPAAVLAHHYPHVPNLGDMTRFKEWPDAAIDVLVGGTPCQDLSVAGKRAGLDGERSGLFHTFVEIADKYKPEYIVWENVPGALSTNDGKDIQKVIDSFTQIGYACDIDIHDAQHFGLAQRRRRVFIVCVRLDALLKKKTPLSERVAGELLAQPLLDTWAAILQAWCPDKSLSGYAHQIEQSASSALRKIELLESALGASACTKLLNALNEAHRPATAGQIHSESTLIQLSDPPADASKAGIGGFPSWSTENESGGKSIATPWSSILADLSVRKSASITSTSIPATMQSKICSFAGQTLCIAQSIINSKNCSGQPKWSSDYWNLASLLLTTLEAVTNYARQASGDLFSESSLRDDWRDHIDEARLLACQSQRNSGNEPSPAAVFSLPESLQRHPAPRRQAGQGVAPTISSRPTGGGGLGTDFDCDGGLIGTPLVPIAFDARQIDVIQYGDKTGPLDTNGHTMAISTGWAVRRLTPIECEALQGFPRGYTNIPWRGKDSAPDGCRYKSLGNSMAVNVMRWIGQRIQMVENLNG